MVEIAWGSKDGSFPFRNEHVVQLYRKDEELVRGVAAYAYDALRIPSQTFVALASRDHLAALLGALERRGLDVAHATKSGRIVTMAVDAALPRFMRGGRPDPQRFRTLVAELFAKARGAATFHHVYVFGELVNELVQSGNPEAARQLEGLWEELRESQPFTLFCGYQVPANTEHPKAFIDLVQQDHTHIFFERNGPSRPEGVLVELAHPSKEDASTLVSVLHELHLA